MIFFTVSVTPTNLQTFLDNLELSSYMSVFEEQDIDLQLFLAMTDQDFKEIGIV